MTDEMKPITARDLHDALGRTGKVISMRTAYAIMRGRIGLSVDKLAALGRDRPDLATWGVVCWFAARREALMGQELLDVRRRDRREGG